MTQPGAFPCNIHIGALVPRRSTTAGVPGPRRNADERDAGWFAPVATRRRTMLAALIAASAGLATSPGGGDPPGPPAWRPLSGGPFFVGLDPRGFSWASLGPPWGFSRALSGFSRALSGSLGALLGFRWAWGLGRVTGVGGLCCGVLGGADLGLGAGRLGWADPWILGAALMIF